MQPKHTHIVQNHVFQTDIFRRNVCIIFVIGSFRFHRDGCFFLGCTLPSAYHIIINIVHYIWMVQLCLNSALVDVSSRLIVKHFS